MRRFLVPLVCMALAVAFTACGDDEERLTAEEWREQADAICERGNDEIEERAEEAFGDLQQGEAPDPDSEEVEEFYDFFTDNIRGQIDEVRDLEPPEDLEEEVDAFLDQADEDFEKLEDGGTEAFVNEEAEDPFEETNELAGDLGLSVCTE